jgi:benzoate-CoA ligase
MTVAVSVPQRFNAAAFFLDRHLAEGRGDRIAFRYRGRNVTYAEVAARASRAAGALRARGVDIEQRVLLALPDCPQFAEAFWGAIRLGAVPVPLDPGLRAADYAFFVEDSRARAVVTHPAIAADFLAAPCRGGRRPPVLVVGAPPSDTESYEDALAAAAPVGEPADTSRDDVALWGYTSGSTGRPKAAVHLQRDLVCAAELVGRGIFGIGPDDLILSASKLFFAFGLGNSLYFPALAGAASVLIPERLDAEDLLAMVAAERPTHLFAVATVYARLLQVPDAARRFDLGSLRICVSSGESLPAGVYQGWRDRFGLELLDVVGSTEALHDYLANRPGASRAGASGQVIPGFEARLVDGEGRPVLLGATGELWIKGESTATGYWNRHAESRRTMQGVAPHRGHVLPGHRRLLLFPGPRRRHAEGRRGLGIAGGSRGLPGRASRRAGGRGDRPPGRGRPHPRPRLLRAPGRRGGGCRARRRAHRARAPAARGVQVAQLARPRRRAAQDHHRKAPTLSDSPPELLDNCLCLKMPHALRH